jgi:glycosyltransferase involved in cell wall biosynthesis
MLLSNAFRPDPRVLKEARSLAHAGYDVTVIAWDREGKFAAGEPVDGFAVKRVQDVRSGYGVGVRQAFLLPRFWLRAWQHLDKLKPMVVHCHDFDTLPPGWLWAKLHRRRVIYDAHEYYVELQKPRLTGVVGKALLAIIGTAEQSLSRTADAVITVDERIARQYRNHRVVIVGHYPPIDFAEDAATRSQTEAPSERATPPGGTGPSDIGDNPHQPCLVYAGRFSTDRGMLVIAEALRRVAAAGFRPHAHLLGTWTSRAEEQAFAEAIRGLEDQIEVAGWVPFDQVAHQLRKADIALAILQPIPRYVTALPVKLFEYMACGLPVIISDFPPNRAVVAAADCGILIDPTNTAAVAAAIQHLLTHSGEARRLGQNGRQAFEASYNWQALEPRLFDLYSDLTADG